VSTLLEYRLRVRDGDDTADLFTITSIRGGDNPYIAEPPEGDGESLDPLTGKVEVGSYTIRVIDAVGSVSYETVVATDGMEYADLAALNAAWPETDTMGAESTWTLSTSVIDSGATSAQLALVGTLAEGENCYRTRTFTGLAADTLHRVRMRVWLNLEMQGSSGIAFGVEVVGGTAGYIEEHGPINAWRTVEATGTTNGSGELTVRFGAFDSVAAPADRLARFDTLEIIQGVDAQDRIITGFLADATGRQQLLSKRAFIEEREDEGSWTTLTAGYITDLALDDALTWTFSIGSTQRIEQSRRVFDRCPNPAEFPHISSKHDGGSISSDFPAFLPTLDRASCIVGGPIIGDWGAYEDRGRPVFRVDSLLDDSGYVRLKWVEGFVHHREENPPVEEDVRDVMNGAALEYLDSSSPVPLPGSAFRMAPLTGLVCRLYDASTGAWLSDHLPMAIGPENATLQRFIGDWYFVGTSVEIYVAWSDGVLPSLGDRYRLAVFPTAASERNPFHVSGHPVEIACSVFNLLGLPYNDSSRVDVKADLGFNLKVHLRITESATAVEWLENTIYGPFGFATRLNDDGEQEFFLTREVGAESVGTITLDDLHSDDGVIWNLKEQTAANRVVWKSRSFLVNDAPSTYETSMPIDGIQEATVTVEVEPTDPTNEHAVFGDREIQYDLPGEIEGYYSGTQENPGPLDHFVAAIATPLFDWQGRGAIRGEINALRGSAAYDAKIGETLTLDLPHYPSAVVGDTPTSQRGSQARRAFVLQRTRTPEGATVAFEDRGPADDPGLVPEFTLDPDATYPNTVVEVTVTNETDLIGYQVRWEMLAAAIEPSAGQFVRMWTPGNGDNPFDLPAVCAGSTVWVRGRVESPEGEVGAWSPFQSEDLADLTVPSDLETTVSGTQVTLTWTNGEDTLPVEVLFRLADEDTYTVANVLPPGSTTYTWSLPSAETEYRLAVRYRAGPSGCVSLVEIVDVVTDVHLDLSAPINPAAWANGAGTFGMEVDGTAFPSGTEFWVAVETAVGSSLAGTFELGGELTTTPERMRYTHPFIAANDGKLRYLKARHRRGTQFSAYTAEVSIYPWLVIAPPPNPTPDPEPEPSKSNVPICVPLLVLPGNRKLVEVPEEAEPLDAFGGAQDVVPLNRFTTAHITGVVNATTLPDGAFVAAQAEVPFDSDNWVYLDAVNSGPYLEVGPTAVGVDLGKARFGADVTLDSGVQGLFRVRGVIVGGDADEVKALLGPRFTLWLDSLDDAEPPEIEPEAPIEYPGSCTIPAPLDMDTGWSETGGGAGNDWTNQSDTTADLAVDGSVSGANYWEKVLTVEPDQQHTIYIDVEQSDARLGAFLQIVDGDEVIAETTDFETLKAQIEECDGSITVRWGIQDSEGAGTGGDLTEALDWANEAAATGDGWVVPIPGGVVFNNGVALGPYSTGVTLNGPAGDHLTYLMTGLTPGDQYRARVWASGSGQASWRYMTLELESGGTEVRATKHGNQGASEITTPTISIAGDGELFIQLETNFVGGKFYAAGLVVEALAGASAGAVIFRDLRYCLGSGVGFVDPDPPDGSEEIPEPIDPGTYPPPPVGGAREFGIFGISAGGYGYWNSTVAAINTRNTVDEMNLARTNECMPYIKFGGERDYRVNRTGPFSLTLWKAQLDAIANNERCMNALEAAIADGTADAHFVIDEPFHPRWGGTIGMATLDAMCDYSKSLFPTWPTILRLAPNDHRLTRAVSNCDIYWGEYKLSSGDPARYRDGCVEAAADMGKNLILGIHYGSFPRPASGIVITPAQLEHYGGILVEAPSDIVLGFHGWIYSDRMYNQPGMPEAVRRVRDKFAARD